MKIKFRKEAIDSRKNRWDLRVDNTFENSGYLWFFLIILLFSIFLFINWEVSDGYSFKLDNEGELILSRKINIIEALVPSIKGNEFCFNKIPISIKNKGIVLEHFKSSKAIKIQPEGKLIPVTVNDYSIEQGFLRIGEAEQCKKISQPEAIIVETSSTNVFKIIQSLIKGK